MAAMKTTAAGRHPELAGTVSLTQLARRWKTTRKSVRQLLGDGRLDFVQINGRLRVPYGEVDRFETGRGRSPG